MYKYLMLLLLVAGCAPGVVPVTGRLTKGTEPIAGVMVSLSPIDASSDASVAHGGTEPDGKFTLYSLPRKGVIPGVYKVTLQPPTDGPAAKLVPSKFTDINKTTWKITIPPAGILDLQLDVSKDTIQ